MHLFLFIESKADLKKLEVDQETGEILNMSIQAHSDSTMKKKIEVSKVKRAQTKKLRRANFGINKPSNYTPNLPEEMDATVPLKDLLVANNPLSIPSPTASSSLAASPAENSPAEKSLAEKSLAETQEQPQQNFFSFDTLLDTIAHVIDLNGMQCLSHLLLFCYAASLCTS